MSFCFLGLLCSRGRGRSSRGWSYRTYGRAGCEVLCGLTLTESRFEADMAPAIENAILIGVQDHIDVLVLEEADEHATAARPVNVNDGRDECNEFAHIALKGRRVERQVLEDNGVVLGQARRLNGMAVEVGAPLVTRYADPSGVLLLTLCRITLYLEGGYLYGFTGLSGLRRGWCKRSTRLRVKPSGVVLLAVVPEGLHVLADTVTGHLSKYTAGLESGSLQLSQPKGSRGGLNDVLHARRRNALNRLYMSLTNTELQARMILSHISINDELLAAPPMVNGISLHAGGTPKGRRVLKGVIHLGRVPVSASML